MESSLSTGGGAAVDSELRLTGIPSGAYQQHLDAMLATLQLNPDDVKLSVLATLQASGEARVWVRGLAAGETVSTQIEVDSSYASGLQAALASTHEAIMSSLKLAVARTMLALTLEGR